MEITTGAFFALFELMPVGVMITHYPTDDPLAGSLVAANSAACDALGFDIRSFIGTTMVERGDERPFDDDEAAAGRTMLFDVVATGETLTIEEYRIGVGPGAGLYHTTMLALPGRLVASIFRRVDGDVAATQALEWAVRSLDASNRELGRFASTIAHDLKNPLTGISGFAQLLHLQRERLDDDLHRPVERIIDLAGRSAEMIDGMLSYSRRAGTASDETASLDDVARWAIEMLAHEITRVGGVVHIEPLPIVRGDSSALRQVVLNLLSNAVRYRRHDRDLVIDIAVRGADVGDIAITVTDNGVGIGVEQRDRVFEWGHRGDRSLDTKGSGMGLAACRAVLRNVHAEIFVDEPPITGGTVICLDFSSQQIQ